MWACCYRKGGGINTNMKLENLHRLIKVVYQKGTKMQRIDSHVLIRTLLKVVRNKYYDRVFKLSRMKMPYIIQKINSAHRRCLEIKDDDVDEKDSSFYVKSQTVENIIYCVQKVSDTKCSCNVICRTYDSCIHKYQCSCPEYLINVECVNIYLKFASWYLREKSSTPFTGIVQNTSSADEKVDVMIDLLIENKEEISQKNNLLDEIKEQVKLMNVDLEKRSPAGECENLSF